MSARTWKRAPHLGEPRPPLEAAEQRALAQYLDVRGVLWCHVPNGGERNRVEAARLVGQGVKRGVPDVLIFEEPKMGWEAIKALGYGPNVPIWRWLPWSTKFCNGVAIELKRRGATASDVRTEQEEWCRALAKRGWYVFVARGAGEAIEELQRIGIGRRR